VQLRQRGARELQAAIGAVAARGGAHDRLAELLHMGGQLPGDLGVGQRRVSRTTVLCDQPEAEVGPRVTRVAGERGGEGPFGLIALSLLEVSLTEQPVRGRVLGELAHELAAGAHRGPVVPAADGLLGLLHGFTDREAHPVDRPCRERSAGSHGCLACLIAIRARAPESRIAAGSHPLPTCPRGTVAASRSMTERGSRLNPELIA
jgi:hypothetical protein